VRTHPVKAVKEGEQEPLAVSFVTGLRPSSGRGGGKLHRLVLRSNATRRVTKDTATSSAGSVRTLALWERVGVRVFVFSASPRLRVNKPPLSPANGGKGSWP